MGLSLPANKVPVDSEVVGMKLSSDGTVTFDSDAQVLFQKTGINVSQMYLDNNVGLTVPDNTLTWNLYVTNENIVLCSSQVISFLGKAKTKPDLVTLSIIDYSSFFRLEADKSDYGVGFGIDSTTINDHEIMTAFFSNKEEILTLLKCVCEAWINNVFPDDDTAKSTVDKFLASTKNTFDTGFEYSTVLGIVDDELIFGEVQD